MDYLITVPPTTTPVSVGDAKLHVHIDHDDENEAILTMIESATRAIERYCGRAFCTQTRKVAFQRFEKAYYLPGLPIQSVASLSYTSRTGVSADWSASNYYLDPYTGLLLELDTAVRPNVELRQYNPIEITYVCGYGNASFVPAPIRQAILKLTEHFYVNRGAVVMALSSIESKVMEMGLTFLLAPYKLPVF